MSDILFPLSFKRQYSGPIDIDFVFNTINEMNNYLNNPRRYAGQIATCLELPGQLFILSNDKSEWLSVVGSVNPNDYYTKNELKPSSGEGVLDDRYFQLNPISAQQIVNGDVIFNDNVKFLSEININNNIINDISNDLSSNYSQNALSTSKSIKEYIDNKINIVAQENAFLYYSDNKFNGTDDVVFYDNTIKISKIGLIIESDNGTLFRIKIDNDGNLMSERI